MNFSSGSGPRLYRNAFQQRTKVGEALTERHRWYRCRDLRSYLAALCHAANERFEAIEKDGDLDRKLESGELVADRYDPLTSLRRQLDHVIHSSGTKFQLRIAAPSSRASVFARKFCSD